MTRPDAEQLATVNRQFAKLIGAAEPADLTPTHAPDELMVWFLLGGKDVGKSTFLNSLLATDISKEPPGEAEGTRMFVAYVHASARAELESRLDGLPIEIRFFEHESDAHRRLCLIDSPDFDSRYQRHVDQVRQVLTSGVTDGAVLLASPSKYKDAEYWNAFASLSGALSHRHILFTLTKADELDGYLDEVRDDFAKTVSRRLGALATGNGGGDPAVYAIDSIRRAIDFGTLERRLLKKMSADEVRGAQEENQRRAVRDGVKRIREHYHLDEIAGHVAETVDEKRLDELFEEHFPPAYFETVAERLAQSRVTRALVKERLMDQGASPLAGSSTILSAFHWLGSRLPLMGRSGTPGTPASAAELMPLLKWGQEPLEGRLAEARRDIADGLRLESSDALSLREPEPGAGTEELGLLLEDHLARRPVRGLRWPVRFLINLPVYFYLVLFVTLLLYPVFLFLNAWDLFPLPKMAEVLTLDNVKVSVIGFVGYYVMASLYIARRQKERVAEEARRVAGSFAGDLRTWLRAEAARPVQRFAESFQDLQGRLDRLAK